MTGWTSTPGDCPDIEVVIAGRPPMRAGGLAEIALILATYASTLGFAQIGVRQSRVFRSGSRYLFFTDPKGNRWKVRISDHRRRPRRFLGQEPPHFDLVSFDGRSGLDRAKAWMDSVANGKRPWFPLPTRPKPKPPHPAASPLAWRESE